MKRRIEKGLTVIMTADDHIGIRNKLGYIGVSYYNNTGKYRADIQVGDKKYTIGVFDELQDAVKARKIADIKKHAGCIDAWFASKPHGNNPAIMDFWQKEFEEID